MRQAIGIEADAGGQRRHAVAGLAYLGHDPGGNTHHGRPRVDIPHHHRIRTDAGAGPNGDGAQHLGAGAHDHVVLECGVALARIPTGAAKGDLVVERDVLADLGRLADDHAHAVVDEETTADAGARVDLDAGQKAGELGVHPGQPGQTMVPQPMTDAMRPQGLQPRITGQHFPHIACCGVAVEDAPNVIA